MLRGCWRSARSPSLATIRLPSSSTSAACNSRALCRVLTVGFTSASAGEDEEEARWRRLAAANCNDKYRGRFSTIRDDELTATIEKSVAAVESGSDPEEERWLKYAAMCGNKSASKAIGTKAIRGGQAWVAFQRDEERDEIMAGRVESELLRKVKQTLAGQREPRPSPKDVPCPRMATARKPSKTGRAPAAPRLTPRSANEGEFIAEQETAVRAKLREKLEARL